MIQRCLLCICIILLQHCMAQPSFVQCKTTKGSFVIQVNHEWSPLGAQRFMDLTRSGFFDDIAFYRCVDEFITQFGISDKAEHQHWHDNDLRDDMNLHLGIQKHYVSFAGGGPNTRSTQIFIAFEDLDFLGKEPWETPFGIVVEGTYVLQRLYKGYGDMPPFGNGPDQEELMNRGNAYIREEFPLVDFIESCVEVTKDQGDAEL